MSEREPFVAVGLLTQRDLDVLGKGFRNAFPLSRDDTFAALLEAIDEAQRRADLARKGAAEGDHA